MSDNLQTIPDQKNILIHFDQNDPVMAQVIRRFGPLKLKRNRNYFVVLCKAIVAQQISVAAADTITGRFQALFDGSAPTPERVLKLSDAVLRGVGLSRQKVAYLKDLSCHFHEKAIRPHRLHYMDNEEVIRQLTAVHGIGRWTAEMFLIFSLNRPDVLPVGDLGLQLGLKKLYRMRKLPTVKRMRTFGKKWHPLETVATWYAWRTQDEKIIAY
ncbi:MAG: DNA-3-methyladenine glycosylase 2 family protein [Nitrospinaceae bacterium]|jgi:DNA-3-methyladenine glycosylase II|nr:DNA-3-methyladenine glycosylase [Pseudomonadota bacterium]MDP6476416.1 DNA-3-methyladenine glycosylase 2 family protein [Nitrospinaceae bacterium]MDP6712639.1 DNA-3-methyladenine glycosylase 2 family protein [Nitrospinaceae bacterium]MDP7058284.1 DNA-3-methyladenine glycosylase 2 family protein [Nitrospinaceae bacterium]HAK37218.1 DNA-3-methyladenine glycosylase [Nitrospina sp.]|tara:strand:- start:5550 stop:6188 length:639 start_codon:yes stop_codon:yes gene_type:complete